MATASTGAAERQRRYRLRQRKGRWLVEFEMSPSLCDALEVAGFAPNGIETREEAAAAIEALLDRWEVSMDRLRPIGIARVTRNGAADEHVLDHSNRGGHHDDDP